MGTKRSVISIPFDTKEERDYYNDIAVKEGYGSGANMCRVALFGLFKRKKLQLFKDVALTDRES